MNFKAKKRIEAEYVRTMKKLMDHFFSTKASVAEILDSMRSGAANPLFQKWAEIAAKRMITGVYEDNAQSWREAAREDMQGRQVFKLLSNELKTNVGNRAKELIRQNADLISSLPLKVAADVNKLIAEEANKGKRFEEIMNVKTIARHVNHLTVSRIKLIARTETSKASTALTRSRSEDLGLDFYIWRTSKDARVRRSHGHMDDVIVPWNDAPNPEQLAGIKSKLGRYHAGDAPNDRCYPEPIVSLDRVQWPHKVYSGGRIVMMTRSAFERKAT